ncbi:MAG: tRNA preQ1(34) S-adenosylmethionine ribosyltransferase-isomerase QueA [Eubacterium sp.]|nr:tRNA preQ1(34) S-adenosylmethionine ribosyltransferase-isomerase QueA [Eubacterium sp.]
MKTSDFSYELPEELIAQDPLEDRSASRLMVLDREGQTIEHRFFRDICEFLQPGDCLVRNNTRVIPARLLGVKRDTGAHVEVFLLKRREGDVWETLVRPGKKLRVGAVVAFGGAYSDAAAHDVEATGAQEADGTADAPLVGEIIEVLPDGNRLVKFTYEGIFEEVLDALGQTPLPPYIHHELKDRNRYQTVYAKYDGSAAAPTAGLHFTEELFDQVREMGVEVAEVTLHVGLGTFRPVKVDDVTQHQMHSEWYRILPEEAEKINRCKAAGGRIICVGTTSCRTIESATDDGGVLYPGEGDTDIFIYPGYRFKILDALITNFHLPESTLLMLVSALAGRDFILDAYEEAVRERYRFFSFGDAMFIK